ncbi:MAG: hypothetical protein HN348_05125 [Proteobacteria bacterium]|nr:hypothetical protein [Pseudomonadota bacterium]
MPTLKEALADHVEELIALAQFSELDLFTRRPGGKSFETDGAPASVAVIIDAFKDYCGPDWKAMVLRLVETYRQAQAEDDYTMVWLLLYEMVQTRWAATALQPNMGGSTFKPGHALSNAGAAAAEAERNLTLIELGLGNDRLPISSAYVQPRWWEAVDQSGQNPQQIAMYFVNIGGAK